MKTIKCYECDTEFQAASREEMLGMLYDHYMKDHNEIITNVTEDEKKTWMAKFDKDWNEAKEA